MRATTTTVTLIAAWMGANVWGCATLVGVDGEYGDPPAGVDASVDSSGGAGGSAGAAGSSAGGSSSGGSAGTAAGGKGGQGTGGTSSGGAAGTGGAASGGASTGGAAGSGGVAHAVTIVNGDFEASTVKTWFWDWDGSKGTGALVPGAIPGWSTDEDPGIGGDSGKGDSGVEPGGNPGMRLFVNSIDWAVYQTTGYQILAGDSFRLNWDQLDTYVAQAGDKLVLVATLYYVSGNNRVAIQSATFSEPQSSTYVMHTFEVPTVPAPSVGKFVGIAFDNTTAGGQAWIGVDNVKLTAFH